MFFAKLSTSLALIAPLVSALTIETPTGWTSGGPATINWTAVQGDPQSFSIELINNAFNRQFALANNVATGSLSASMTLPIVPLSPTADYTVQFVNIGNLTDVFAESAAFAISESASSTTSSTASASASLSGSGSASASVSASASLTSTVSSSAIGTTRSASSVGATNTGTSTGTDSAAVGSSTSFDSGAVSLGLSNNNLASFAVMAVAAVAGARFVGF
ncbi:hypothetical protein ACEPAG_68 [Sanghuangporus baumii]